MILSFLYLVFGIAVNPHDPLAYSAAAADSGFLCSAIADELHYDLCACAARPSWSRNTNVIWQCSTLNAQQRHRSLTGRPLSRQSGRFSAFSLCEYILEHILATEIIQITTLFAIVGNCFQIESSIVRKSAN